MNFGSLLTVLNVNNFIFSSALEFSFDKSLFPFPRAASQNAKDQLPSPLPFLFNHPLLLLPQVSQHVTYMFHVVTVVVYSQSSKSTKVFLTNTHSSRHFKDNNRKLLRLIWPAVECDPC